MLTTLSKSESEPALSKPANGQPPNIATASISDTLAALHVDADTGLTRAEVDVRRKEHGYNEVAVRKGQAVLKFLWEIPGHLGVDARTDHGSVGRAGRLFGPGRGERPAGDQRRVEL
jgi:hypothetical protein